MINGLSVVLVAAAVLASPAGAASIFTTQVPASGNTSSNSRSVELGVRFRADVAGRITGLRFYKIAANTGAHTGHLWTSTGALLGSLTFTGETATGWQTAVFASSIPIQAGVNYVASYHTAASYAVTRQAFATAGIDNPPLHALQDGVAGPNGVYAYAAGAVFPNRGTRSSNYWVDVLFTAGSPDTTAPAVAISSPAAGAFLRGTLAVTAAASDNIAVTTVQFKLDGAPLGPLDLAAPYSTTWNTVASGDGSHNLTAVAWDAAGNASTSAIVSVTVDNTPPLISSVAAAVLGPSSATVTWLTDEPATAQVEYGTSTSYGSLTALDASTVTAHSRLLTGLAAGTLYHYRARSSDRAGNLAVSGDGTFTTSPPPPPPSCQTSSAGAWQNFPFPPMSGFFVAEFDATPHAANMDGVMGLSNGAASAFADLADIVRFNTAGFIDARNGGAYAAAGPLPYGPGTNYHFTLEVNLASHTYTAYVSSPSAARQLVGSDFAFRTEQNAVSSLNNMGFVADSGSETVCDLSVYSDTAPPLISSVAVTDIGVSSAAVAWLTDEPATSQVEYGTTTAYGSLTALDASTVANHAQVVTGLSSATLYHYRVRSADAAGNLALSGDFTFTTAVVPDLTPPSVSISSPAADAVVRATVTVVAAAFDDVAVATVQFRLDGADLGPPDDAAPHEIDWNTALSSDGAHALDAVAWDAAGNASTSAAVAVTVDNTPPLISSVAAAVLGPSSATVTWLTDEPATAQVEYGTSTSYGSLTALDSSTSTAHVRILTGLAAGTTYHYRARSADSAGNLAVSDDFTVVPVDSSPPSVSISSPAADAVVRATVAVVAAAFDDVAVATVQFRLDGADLGPPDDAAPYEIAWNTALSSDGAHALDAVAWDAAGNASTAAAVAVTVDNTPPLISSVAAAVLGPSSATVTWLTDEPATAQVEYGTTTAYGSLTALDSSTATSHARVLSGLASGTTYHFRVRSSDAAGNLATSGDFDFSTAVVPDLSPPTVSISSPAAGAVAAGTVTVVASAFDDVAVATVQFRLDGADLGPPDDAAPYEFAWDTTASSDGAHFLSAEAWDSSGNASTSAAVSVTVDNTAPLISSVAVTDIGVSSAAVSWITDEPATSQVEYGTTTAYGSLTALDSSTVASHAQAATGLSSSTLYHYRVRSADAAGNLALSGDATFFTTAPAGLDCLTSAGAWRNLAFPPQVSSFTVSFDVTPSSAGMNASVGVSTGATGSLAGLAAAVRFNPQGFIDVRYSTSYARMSSVAYSTGIPYHFDLRVNASAHLFDAYVTPQGSTRTMLARNYTFHSNQSTSTVLGNLGLFASPGAATMCNLTVSASTVPWWDGIREIYATAVGSKTWYSSWDNGINRAFVRAVDPTDPWFDANHGTASFLVDADSGVFKISGTTPRMYIHHPEFVMGSSSLTVADALAKQWRDVEVTVYGMRVADSNIAYAGINGVARSNHGMTGSETVDLCDTRGIGSRFRFNGRLDFEKETRHPTTFVVNTTTTSLWPTGTSMPFNVWIGFKYAVYDLPNGNVKVESYMDMTNGAGGGNWVLVNQFEDNGANWGGGTPCAAGINPQERLTNGASRPGSESGLPNISVYFRSDGIGTNGLLYKKMSVREIVAPPGGPGPLAALGAPPEAAAAPAAAEEFSFRDLYAFPNPSRRGERVTIRLQAGVADAVEVSVYDLSGRRVAGGGAEGPVLLDDGNGKGAQFTYDYHWDVSGAASAVYFYSVRARKQGQAVIGRTGKVALIK